MEEMSEQIVSSLAVIHRFMSAHTTDNLQGSTMNVHEPMQVLSVSEAENANTLTIVCIHTLHWNKSIGMRFSIRVEIETLNPMSYSISIIGQSAE